METVIDAEYRTLPGVELVTREDERIIAWRQDIASLLRCSQAAEVTDLDSERGASSDLVVIATLAKDIEIARKDCKAPILEAGRIVDQWFARLTEDLVTAKNTYQRKITSYHAEVERVRKEAEAINREVGQDVVDVPDQQKRVRSDIGTVSFVAQVDREKVQAAVDAGVREIPGVVIYPVWTFKVLDLKAVPEEYRKVGTRVNGVRW